MPDHARNIFVLGDLVIDHTVFVKDPEKPRLSKPHVPVYEVVRRLDTVGGAASCARILSVLNPESTFLWGLIGKSNWGDFRTILEHCQLMDGSYPNIRFRGVQDETHAQMNTITRLIKPESINNTSYDPPVSVLRFDDYGHVHIPEDKRDTVLHYLERVHQKYILDGIVIIDLDMNCLKAELIGKIADFAGQSGIHLFVNPKHDRTKYKDIEGTAICSSLSEWCHLVGQEQEFNSWKTRLDRVETLIRMAQLSFQYLGNFTYHIVECGAAGAILMAPHPQLDDRYAVYKVAPHESEQNKPKPQLGCAKLMLAVFALEVSGDRSLTSETALRAFKRAKAALSCYRDMPWQRMPSRESVNAETSRVQDPQITAEPSKGMLFLPKETRIRLSDPKHRTRVPGLFSVDATFRSVIDVLINDIQKGLEIGDSKSIILGAPSGCGKSTILQALAGEFGERMGIKLIEVKTPEEEWKRPDKYFERLIEDKGAKADRLLIAIDESLKSTMNQELIQHGVKLLDSGHAHNVRFLFIDAGFVPGGDLPVNSEFTSRCVPYYLSGLKHRLMDIPYIVAGMVFRRGDELHHNLSSVRFEGKFLLTFVNAALSHPHLRDLRTWVREAYDAANAEKANAAEFILTPRHLPKALNEWAKQASDFVEHEYEFMKPDET